MSHQTREFFHTTSPATVLGIGLTAVAALGLLSTAGTAEARGSKPATIQATYNTVGTVGEPKLRSKQGENIVFHSDGDVMGAGTEHLDQREIYFYDVDTGALQRLTTATDGSCESYNPARVTDDINAGGRPDQTMFVSNCDLDASSDNSDGNPEIFIYDTFVRETHQLTNTVGATHDNPWCSDSGRCCVFQSTADLDNNDGSIDPVYNPGTGYSNPDGSEEIMMYTVETSTNYPYDGYFTQVSNGPAGTRSIFPVMGGYVHPRQCQTTAWLSDHDQLNEGTVSGFHMYLYRRNASETTRPLNNGAREGGPIPLEDGNYTRPHISAASPFARGPYIVFSTDTDMWDNGSTGLQLFRYRVFHELMQQYAYSPVGDVRQAQISDGGGFLTWVSTDEMLDPRKGAKGFGPGVPMNDDGNSEIFWTKGRRKAWQITRSTGCTNDYPSINNEGRKIAFRSDCDLVGLNPNGVEQVFIHLRLKKKDPLFLGCEVNEGCCNIPNGCYTDYRGRLAKIPRRFSAAR